MTGQSFSANPDDVTAGSRVIRELAQFTKNLGLQFDADFGDLSWTGTDSFGDQLRPKVERNGNSVKQTVKGVEEGIDAISDGTLSNLGTILNTQGSVIQSIDQHGAGGHT